MEDGSENEENKKSRDVETNWEITASYDDAVFAFFYSAGSTEEDHAQQKEPDDEGRFDRNDQGKEEGPVRKC